MDLQSFYELSKRCPSFKELWGKHLCQLSGTCTVVLWTGKLTQTLPTDPSRWLYSRSPWGTTSSWDYFWGLGRSKTGHLHAKREEANCIAEWNPGKKHLVLIRVSTYLQKCVLVAECRGSKALSKIYKEYSFLKMMSWMIKKRIVYSLRWFENYMKS